jgi:Ca-activated chloride channel family protein
VIRLFGLEFAAPWALLLLLAIPALWLWRRRRHAPAIVFSRADVLARGPRAGRGIARLLVTLRALAIAALVVALARPRTGARAETITSEGINIVLVVDLSSSMLAEDFQPQNRLEVAKDVVKQFVNGRRSDRIGLVAFAGEALTQVPLTLDYPVILAAVDHLHAGLLEDGTAIGTAIATAANRLRDAPGRSRVMILLTDGENNRGSIDPRTAAQAAGAYDIRIYTIGAGTEVARSTGGRYFRARDAAALQRIYEQIDRLERVPVTTRTYTQYTERYRWPLAFMLLAIAAEMALLAWRGPLP